jgi:hypothetical protein
MSSPASEYPKDDPSPNMYVLTEHGLILQQDSCDAVGPVAKKRSWGSPLLWISLLLALSAYYLDAGKWAKSVEASIDRRQQSLACVPYRAWVAQHPLSYDDVAANSLAWTGKPVLWEISRGPDEAFYYGQDAAKKVSWTNPAADGLAGLAQGGSPAKVLALIESNESATPQLIFLEIDK